MYKLPKELEETAPKLNTIQLKPLPYEDTALQPVLSKENIDFHHDVLAQGYVDRYNNKEGDPEFNLAGAFLHNIYFPQFKSPEEANLPTGTIEKFINSHFKDEEDLQQQMLEQALKIQGSGWVYLASKGKIETIKNHQVKLDIVILIDFWEHAYQRDYGSDKKTYFENTWKLFDWRHINQRIKHLDLI